MATGPGQINGGGKIEAVVNVRSTQQALTIENLLIDSKRLR
jgi:hypothetical protein